MRIYAAALLGALFAGAGWPSPAASARHGTAAHAAAHRAAPVQAGRVHRGRASVFSTRLRGRQMADGTRFDPASDAAASKHLPLGTRARVTNLANGRSALVTVRDRGPYGRGRILDVSPRSAAALGMGHGGTAPVAVAALTDRPGGSAGR